MTERSHRMSDEKCCVPETLREGRLSQLNGFVYLIEQRILDTNAEKPLS
jgi:hypothetical protein